MKLSHKYYIRRADDGQYFTRDTSSWWTPNVDLAEWYHRRADAVKELHERECFHYEPVEIVKMITVTEKPGRRLYDVFKDEAKKVQNRGL